MQRWLYLIYKVCLIKYEFDINGFNFEKKIIFNCGFSTKVTCVFLLRENIWELSEKTFRAKKTTISYTLFINIIKVLRVLSLIMLSLHEGVTDNYD